MNDDDFEFTKWADTTVYVEYDENNIEGIGEITPRYCCFCNTNIVNRGYDYCSACSHEYKNTFGNHWMYLEWAREIIISSRQERKADNEYYEYLYSVDTNGAKHMPKEILTQAAQFRYGEATAQHVDMVSLDADTGLGVHYLSSEPVKPRNDAGKFIQKTKFDDELEVMIRANPKLGGRKALKILSAVHGEGVLSLPTLNRRIKTLKTTLFA
ncbi:hypothetical protein EKD04_012945 [Chloroflexales bacterium ZM16-3]|nr:hypothetical protein [Chloroflexales bacterium ZM16-3]